MKKAPYAAIAAVNPNTGAVCNSCRCKENHEHHQESSEVIAVQEMDNSECCANHDDDIPEGYKCST